MDLAYKLQTFQGLNARELTLLGSIPGANVIERQIHKQFDHLRVRGEWFKLTDEIANYLNTLEA